MKDVLPARIFMSSAASEHMSAPDHYENPRQPPVQPGRDHQFPFPSSCIAAGARMMDAAISAKMEGHDMPRPATNHRPSEELAS